MQKVLILCTSNSARSQMAEAILKHIAGDRFDVRSAGTKPVAVRPEAITVMRELGIDISGNRAKSIDEFSGESFDYMLTVCSSANVELPRVSGTHESFASQL